MAEITLFEAAKRLDEDYRSLWSRARKRGVLIRRPNPKPKGGWLGRYHDRLYLDEADLPKCQTRRRLVTDEEVESILADYYHAPDGLRPTQDRLANAYQRSRWTISQIIHGTGRFVRGRRLGD